MSHFKFAIYVMKAASVLVLPEFFQSVFSIYDFSHVSKKFLEFRNTLTMPGWSCDAGASILRKDRKVLRNFHPRLKNALKVPAPAKHHIHDRRHQGQRRIRNNLYLFPSALSHSHAGLVTSFNIYYI